jgi:hypothetical protein
MRALAFAALLVACHSDEPKKPVNMHTMLTATISLAKHDYTRDSEVEVTVELANSTPNPVTIAAQTLDTAALLLEVSDTRGGKIPSSSPPVPQQTDITFAPGEHKVVKLNLGVFSPTLPSGDYIVAPNPQVANGNPMTFHIK